MSKKIAILGSTGSIGRQTLDVVRAMEEVQVVGLAAGSNVERMEEQVREFSPALVCMWDEEKASELRIRIADTQTRVVSGMEGLIQVAVMEGAQIIVTAVVGMIGLRPTIAAMEAGKTIALANKETLVTGGHLIMKLAKERYIPILPVDSEHSAIFQCLNGERPNPVSRILLTASGGPFRGMTREQLKDITVEQALRHPNWTMGHKITIDSSTMVNKGLEVIEAKWLFDVSFDQIEVVVQPESIIHSMVEFQDGAVMAQLGVPDMRVPIEYALNYPNRLPFDCGRLDFGTLREIHFEKPDLDTFRGLKLAYQAGRTGGSLPTVLNAANEWAVSRFLNRRISYLQIADIIEDAMAHHQVIEEPSLEEILETEKETYAYIESRW